MIISRTPFRISFFGGGTDYPAWFKQNGGSVLATTINKYCYITCRYLPPFFEHKYRLMYSRVEEGNDYGQIRHPAVREVIRFLKFDRGLEIHHDGDLPARSGMGSSSAFTVGLLHALHALGGRMPSKQQLATESIHIEQDLLRETVGSQDQILAAQGGFNQIMFHRDGEYTVRPITVSRARIAELNSHLMLFYTGIKRTASRVADGYVHDLPSRENELSKIGELVAEGTALINSRDDIRRFGKLMQEAWRAKRGLSRDISSPYIDNLYQVAIDAGAIGGKLTGAGGGGFLLLFVPPEFQKAVRDALSRLIWVPFKFEHAGSQIIFFDQEEDFSEIDADISSRTIDRFTDIHAAGPEDG
ncbi:MAG TPA: hypothetical protein VGK27_12625 [Candidatus Deferrimicrobiaceae bacterium]|jgi:D-glycero-alpha-D-manno-heptose-7-phosphate kinase